ncbi:MAG: TAXI family TRAP transporter solute-binding subunit [Methyloligellaceae bacterium]
MLALLERYKSKLFISVVAAATTLVVGAASAQAPTAQNTKNQIIKHKANKNTITLVTGGISDTQISFAQDFSDVLDKKDAPGREGLRVLPMLGKGGVQNALDLLHLRGVDLAIMQSDTLAYLRGEDPLFYKNIFDRINYISSLYYAEWHVIARKNIKSLGELRGKKVNISLPLSGTYVTSRKIFELLFIRVKYSVMSDKVALQQLKAGKIDAMALLGGSPISLLKTIKEEDGLHFVPADFYTKSNREFPFVLLLRRLYVPSLLKHEQYPNLIPEGGNVQTVANGIVLAAYNWAPRTHRYQKVVRFSKSFIEKFKEFKVPGRHKKWREVSLANKPYEWRRFRFAEQLLKQNTRQTASRKRIPRTPGDEKLFRDFKRFIKRKEAEGAKISEEQQLIMFRQFRAFMKQNN